MATILEEYFNSYTPDGDLNGKGGWSGDVSFDIGTSGKEGRKGVQNADTSGTDKDISKTGTQRNDGRIAIYLKRTNTTGQTLLVLNEGANERVAVGLYSDGHIKYKNSSGSFVNLGTDTTYSANTWYLLEVEWRSSDHKIRILVDGVQKQDWVSPYSNWTSYLDKVVLRVNQTAGTSYWDYISEFGTSIDTSNWSYNKKYKIDHTKIDENLTDYQALIKIDSTKPNYQHFFDNAGTDGVSVRFVSSLGSSQALLKFEKVRFDSANKKAEYFVKIPSVSKDNDTYFYLIYGRSGALDGSDKTEVWTDDMKAVYHMRDDPDTSHIKDSTINANNGTKKGQNEPIEADGKVEKAQSFDGSDDYINCGHNSSFDITNNFTIEFIIKSASTTQSQKYLFCKDNNRYAVIYEYVDNKIEFFSAYYTGDNPRTGTEITLDDTSYHYIVYTYNGTTWAGYKDGVNIFSSSKNFTLSTSTQDFYLGCSNPTDGNYFSGILDEIRISNVGRSAAYAKATYNSLFDTLITEEVVSTATVSTQSTFEKELKETASLLSLLEKRTYSTTALQSLLEAYNYNTTALFTDLQRFGIDTTALQSLLEKTSQNTTALQSQLDKALRDTLAMTTTLRAKIWRREPYRDNQSWTKELTH